MFGRLLTRCLQTSAGAPVEKAALLELRNKTGYTFSNCKKALQLSDNDVSKAERWLHQQAQEQGWAKASKVTGRARGQGLVAVHRDGPFAAMAEVNCETDFVARTEDFRTFVDKLVRACTSHAKKLPSLVTYRALSECMLSEEELEQLGRGLCQQVVGMRPSSVGLLEDFLREQEEQAKRDAQLDKEAEEGEEKKEGEEEKEEGEGEEIVSKEEEEKEEKRLLFQDYVLDPDIKVGTLVADNHIDVMDFERFECGEPLD